MIEIELKHKINDLEDIRQKIIAAGLEMDSERAYEKLVMYDNPQGLMQEKDGRIRVRTSEEGVRFSVTAAIER